MLQCHAHLVNNGDAAASKRALDRRLDDIIHFNRASVWREQAQFERHHTANARVSTPAEQGTPWIHRPIGTATVLTLAAFVFALLLSLPTMEDVRQRNCLAMVVLLATLWCTEVIPLYVTSMLVPVLTVLLGILPSHHHPDEPMRAQTAAHHVFEVRVCAWSTGPGAITLEWHAHDVISEWHVHDALSTH